MKTTPQILAASNLNPKDKRVVVVQDVDPYEVQKLLPDVLIFVQGTSEDFGDTIFSSEDGVLNVLKPNLFVTDNPTPEDIKLCASFGCVVNSLEHLTEELRILGSVEPDIYEMPRPDEIKIFSSKNKLDLTMIEEVESTLTPQDIENNNAQTI